MRAFSFLEVIIAVTIASIVFVAIFTLAFQNLTAAEATRDRFIAANLAQEGIEIVVNIRSGNWLRFKDDVDLSDGSLIKWRGETSPACSPGDERCLADGTYIAQYNTGRDIGGGAVTALMPSTDPSYNPSLVTDASGRYCHTALHTQDTCVENRPSPFSRTIRIDTESDHHMKVVSTVTWAGGSVQVESRLYNWR